MKMRISADIIVYFICQVLYSVFSRDLYVTHHGCDTGNCGRLASSCRSVRFAVRASHPGDTILVASAQERPYEECNQENSIEIKSDLTIKGTNGKAVIQCRPEHNLFKLQGQLRKGVQLRLSDLILRHSNVTVVYNHTDMNLAIERCVFENNKVGVFMTHSPMCRLRLTNSRFQRHLRHGIVAEFCANTSFTIIATEFNSSSILQRSIFDKKSPSSVYHYQMLISHCAFIGNMATAYQSGVSLDSLALVTNITITDTVFENNIGYNTSEHVLDLKAFSNLKRLETYIDLNRLIFDNNYYKDTVINLIAPETKNHSFTVKLTNSLFRNNTGTMELRAPASQTKAGNRFILANNTFLQNRYFPHPDSTSIYPTVYFATGRFHLDSCRFIDNLHGRMSTTGVVFVSDRAWVTLENCYFENNQVDKASVQVYAYPRSKLETKGKNIFNIVALNDNQRIFTHLPFNRLRVNHPNCKANGFVDLGGEVNVTCPRGFRAHFEGLAPKKDKNCSVRFTYLAYDCLECPRKTYSLERGKISRNTTKDIQCIECPRGGQCKDGTIRAKPNFWGHQVGSEVKFIDCPKGYCCDSHHCPTYYACKGNRTGTLCGQCPSGSSEALFSATCKKNDLCNWLVFSLSVAALLVAYLLFFLFYEDIVLFVRRTFTIALGFSSDEHDSTGIVKIIFYYYQTVYLLITMAGSDEEHSIVGRLDATVSEVFDLTITDTSTFDCPFPDDRAVGKTVVLHSCGFALMVLLAVSCLFWKTCTILTQNKKARDEENVVALSQLLVEEVEDERKHSSSFSVRVVSAFTHISLLMYSSKANLCLTLLHCVPFKDTMILFIDGNVQCYQPFQYILLIYFIISVLPFCLVPFLGSYLLTLGFISVAQFCLGCLLPFPFCCYWICLLLRNRTDTTSFYNSIPADRENENAHREAILHVLSGPFRTHKALSCFPRAPIPWEGVLIFRRLVLLLTFAFTYDGRWRMLLALSICVLILVTHVCMQPFGTRYDNCLETVSLATLVILCGFALVKVLYRGEDYSSLYTNSTFTKSLNLVESVFIIGPIALVVLVVVLSLLVQIIFLFRSCFRVCLRAVKHS